MTLQERMTAVYLRQANLPKEEKDKLRLFLGLLLETMDPEEDWEKEPQDPPVAVEAGIQPGTGRNMAREETAAEAPEAGDGAAGTLSGDAHGKEEKGREKGIDPLADRLLRLMEREGLSQGAAAREITKTGTAVGQSTISDFINGVRMPKGKKLEAISRWCCQKERAAGTAGADEQ